MSLYKNPQTATQLNAPESVNPNRFYGTNFSILGIGGYVEVYSVNDLIYTIPVGSSGPVETSGNTIPIRLNINTPNPDVLTLNSDNISSGRRRLGMLAYVYENETTYQYNIPNYTSLFSAATGTTAVTITQFGTTVDSSTPEGQAFIDAWTASTIEGITPGATYATANWRILSQSGSSSFDVYVTGGTYSAGTLSFTNNSGGTFDISGLTSTDIFVTGLTYTEHHIL